MFYFTANIEFHSTSKMLRVDILERRQYV